MPFSATGLLWGLVAAAVAYVAARRTGAGQPVTLAALTGLVVYLIASSICLTPG